jgi:transposase
MGKVSRKRRSAEFKARVALEAIKGERALAEVGAKHGIHLTMMAAWKRAAVEGMVATFSLKAAASTAVREA